MLILGAKRFRLYSNLGGSLVTILITKRPPKREPSAARPLVIVKPAAIVKDGGISAEALIAVGHRLINSTVTVATLQAFIREICPATTAKEAIGRLKGYGIVRCPDCGTWRDLTVSRECVDCDETPSLDNLRKWLAQVDEVEARITESEASLACDLQKGRALKQVRASLRRACERLDHLVKAEEKGR